MTDAEKTTYCDTCERRPGEQVEPLSGIAFGEQIHICPLCHQLGLHWEFVNEQMIFPIGIWTACPHCKGHECTLCAHRGGTIAPKP